MENQPYRHGDIKQIGEARARDEMNHKREGDKYAICTRENFSHPLHRQQIAVISVYPRSLFLEQAAQTGQRLDYVDDEGEKHDGVNQRDKHVDGNRDRGGLDIFKLEKGLPKGLYPHVSHGCPVEHGKESDRSEKNRGDQIEHTDKFRFGMCSGNAFFQRDGLRFFYIFFHYFASIAFFSESGRLTLVLFRLE